MDARTNLCHFAQQRNGLAGLALLEQLHQVIRWKFWVSRFHIFVLGSSHLTLPVHSLLE
jgi:hypothetical protein